MGCSLPGSSIHGIFQARVQEWVVIAFSTKPGYIILTSTIFRMSITNSTTPRLSLSHTCNKIPIITTLILMILLSIGGLPPLLGFRLKWTIIEKITTKKSVVLPTVIAIMALLYFNIWLTHSTALTLFLSANNRENKTILHYETNNTPIHNNCNRHNISTHNTKALSAGIGI